MGKDFKWDKDGRYKKIALSLVGQCEDEGLTVEESLFVFGLATGEINRQCNCVPVKRAPILPNYCTSSHTP